MKKIVILILTLSFCVAEAYAQSLLPKHEERKLRLIEFEAGFGMNSPRKWEGFKSVSGTNLFVELRVNRLLPSLDFGVQLKGTDFAHKIPNISKVSVKIFTPSFFVDYNWRNPERLSFFAGVGVGRAFAEYSQVVYIDYYDYDGFLFFDSGRSWAITPRVGVIIFENIRVTADYAFAGKYHSGFSLNIGAILSGPYKKVPKHKHRSYGI